MKRQVFYSFHYKADAWRASQVRNMGVVEGNAPVSDNEWEAITQRGHDAIKKWIDEQMKYRSCVIVLIGSQTAGRKWINYEICKALSDGKGLFGIYVHNLKDSQGKQATKGRNPFDDFKLNNGATLSTVVKAYDPPVTDSQQVYYYIKKNLADWVEQAIRQRST